MAIWTDFSQRFLDGTYRTQTASLPVRIAFWCATDFGDITLLAFQTGGARDSHIRIGVNSAGKVFLRRFQTPFSGPVVMQTITSTNALSRNKWAHVCVELLAIDDARLTVNGSDFNTSAVLVRTTLPLNVHIGMSSDHSLGAPYYTDTIGVGEDASRGYICDLAIWRGDFGGGMSADERQQAASMSRPHRFLDPGNLNVYMPLRGGIRDEVNLDTVAGGGTAYWATPPAIVTRYGAYIEVTTSPNDGDQVVVGATTYTFVNVLSGAANEIKISGGTGTLSLNNLAAAIEVRGVAGTDYGVGTTKNATCCAKTFTRGDQNNFTMLVLEIDPTATGAGPAISESTGETRLLGPFDIDGNGPVANLVAPPEVMLSKRPDWIWDDAGGTPSDIGVGANNHDHDAPINWGTPLALQK